MFKPNDNMTGVTGRASLHTLGVAALAAMLCLTACGRSKPDDILHFLQQHKHEVSAIEYRTGVPDTIGISAPRILEIDGETQTIQPDGKINLRLAGEVKVAGMTTKEIAAKLQVLLSRYYVDPKVNVRILNYASKKYYVAGQVGAPGPRPYTGADTLMDAVMRSGTSFLSWLSHVKVIRPGVTDGERHEIVVDVSRMIKEGDWTKNILLEPNDIVYIPPTPLALVGNKLREVLYPVGPALQTYVTPARVMAAQDVYEGDGNNAVANSYGGITVN